MPTIEVNKKDLEKLVGKKLTQPQLEEALMFVKGEIDDQSGDIIKVDVKETNRPDLWSTEGIAREIRNRLGLEKGIKKYKVEKAKTECTIEKSVEKSRPFIACAIVKGIKITENLLVQMIQLQEKVGMTYGRKRKETGIGLYDYDIMKPPIFYRGYKDKEIEFVPLEYKVKMRPSEILMEHPKGKEYAHLLKGVEFFPIVIDSENVVASMLFRIISNSVDTSTSAAAAPAAGAAANATAAACALTFHFTSSISFNFAISRTVKLLSTSTIFSRSAV